MCSLLTSKALEWTVAVNQLSQHSMNSYNFLRFFEHLEGEKEAGELLLALCQGKQMAAEYALTFYTLAAKTTI